jgi:uncharacterized membrane protein
MRYDLKQATFPTLAAVLFTGGLLALYARRDRSPRIVRTLRNSVHDIELPDVELPSRAVGGSIAAVAAVAAGAFFLSSRLRKGPADEYTVEESVEVDVPVRVAYNQWTQFETFPQFMASVESVQQIDDTHLRWRAKVGGVTKEWTAEITEQIPDERIAWRSTGGVPNSGVVTFHKISDERTRIMLQMDYTPQTPVEKAGDAMGATKLTTKGNLKKFKALLESRGHETGGWRGTVNQTH